MSFQPADLGADMSAVSMQCPPRPEEGVGHPGTKVNTRLSQCGC